MGVEANGMPEPISKSGKHAVRAYPAELHPGEVAGLRSGLQLRKHAGLTTHRGSTAGVVL